MFHFEFYPRRNPQYIAECQTNGLIFVSEVFQFKNGLQIDLPFIKINSRRQATNWSLYIVFTKEGKCCTPSIANHLCSQTSAVLLFYSWGFSEMHPQATGSPATRKVVLEGFGIYYYPLLENMYSFHFIYCDFTIQNHFIFIVIGPVNSTKILRKNSN